MGGAIRGDEGNLKRLVAVFIFVLVSGAALSDDFTGQIILEKTSFQLNEEFKLSILIPEISPAKMEIEEPRFPEGIVLLKGPFSRAGRNGSIVDYYFQVTNTGRFIIESFRIRSEGSLMLTIPVFITASATFQIKGTFDKVPPVVQWDLPDRKYCPGEVIPLRFVIKNLETADLSIESHVSQKPEGYVRKTSRTGEKYEKTVHAKKVMTGEVYDVYFHDHIFVVFSPGKVVLPDVEIRLSNDEASYTTKLKGIPLTVYKAPDSGLGTGAIGSFNISYDLSDRTLSESQSILIRHRISGRGNFYGIDMPMPSVDKPDIAEIVLLRDNYETVPSGKLFNGYRELTYSLRKKEKTSEAANLQIENRSGELSWINLVMPDFTWYEENYNELPPGVGLKKHPGAVEEIAVLKGMPENTVAAPPREIIEEKYANILRISALVFTVSLVPAIYLITRRNRKKTLKAAGLVLFFLVAYLLFMKTQHTATIYGVVTGEKSEVSVLAIPELSGSVKFSAETGDKVKIIDQKDLFYFIETETRISGWIPKENIVLE